MRVSGRTAIGLAGAIWLAGCGGGDGVTGSNFSEAPPMAEIVATPGDDETPTAAASPSPTPSPSATLDANAMVDPASGLPVAVAVFRTKRDTCNRLRAQTGDDDGERSRLERQIAENCDGTDAELARLREEYAGNLEVQRALAGYQTDLEQATGQ